MKKVYFDNGSTSFPKAPGVAECIAEILTHGSYNINRGGYNSAYSLSDSVYLTRENLCKMMNGPKARNVVFTNNITSSLNMILKGFLKPGDHVVTSSMEHNAVMRPLVQLEQMGVKYSVAYGDEEGFVSAEAVRNAITDETKAVVMLHASNVCGTVNDLEKIGAVCKEKGVFFICDCAQSAGVIPIDMVKMNISCLCFTGHKSLLGPQGTGGFIITPEFEQHVSPLIAGGTGSVSDSLEMPHSMPDKFESGTMNLPGIVGLGTSIQFLNEVGIENIHKKEMEITKYFIECAKSLPDVRIVGKKEDTVMRTAVVSLDFEKHDNAEVSYKLDDEYGIMTRCGMHCAPMAHKTLKTFPQGTVRFSFGYFSDINDVDYCMDAIKKIIK